MWLVSGDLQGRAVLKLRDMVFDVDDVPVLVKRGSKGNEKCFKWVLVRPFNAPKP